jgi:hypothetical protein
MLAVLNVEALHNGLTVRDLENQFIFAPTILQMYLDDSKRSGTSSYWFFHKSKRDVRAAFSAEGNLVSTVGITPDYELD